MIGFFNKKKKDDKIEIEFSFLSVPEETEHTKVCLSNNEIMSLSLWVKTHTLVCDKGKDGKFIFAIDQKSEGGIGIGTVVRCSCGEKFDITDYGCW